MRLLPLLAALWTALAAPLSAQELRLEGGDTRAARLAREILAEGDYLLLSRDTVLPEDFRTPGDLVVADADVRLEGVVEGRVAVLGGDLFIRPGARIGGPVAVVGGAVYSSGLAEVGEVVQDEAPLEVAVEADTLTGVVRRVRVIPPVGERPVFLPGVAGIRVPTYDRVDGWTLAAGPAWRIGGGPGGARVDAWVSYRTARAALGGGAELVLPLRGEWALRARAARETATNDEWIRGPLSNTLAALFAGTDERDYWAADRGSLTLARAADDPLLEGEWLFAPRVALLASRDESLPTRDPWSLFDELDRPNPFVAEGTVASVLAATAVRWQGRVSSFAGEGWVERTLPEAGDFDFTRWVAEGTFVTQGLRRDEVSVSARVMGTLGGEVAPPQRWSFVGGPNTLPTFEIAELRGDRLVFVEAAYGIPIQRYALPVLGPPTLRLEYRTGTAWLTGTEPPRWLQNVGARLEFSVLHAGVWVDPAAEGLSPTLLVDVALPGSR